MDRDSLRREIDAVQAEAHRIGTRLRLPQVLASELTLQQLKVLTLLRHVDPPMAAHELASTLGVTPATVSGLVARLVEHDLVHQEQDPTDRRSRRLLVTPRGKRTLDELSSIHDDHRLLAESQMSDAELEALLVGLRAFVRGLRQALDVEASPTPGT